MKESSKNNLIAALISIIIILIIVLTYVLISRKMTTKEIRGSVLVVGEKYLIISSENEDYIIENIEGDYTVNDEVKFTYKEKNLDEKSTPKSIKIETAEIIKKADPEDKVPPKDDEDTKPPVQKPDTPDKTNPSVTQKPTQTESADEEVLEYFDQLNTDFDASSIKDTVKNGFITVIDFLFYKGTIKGHTFEDLSSSAKLKVLEMALYFDSKIDTYFPGYKESISGVSNKIYTAAKSEIVETYLNVTAKICENEEALCKTAKSGFATIKKNFGLTWALIKDIAGDGLDNLKNWYEIWSGK